MIPQFHIPDIDVIDCPSCHGNHASFTFLPSEGPRPGQTHYATCPVTSRVFWMDTSKVGRVEADQAVDAVKEFLSSLMKA